MLIKKHGQYSPKYVPGNEIDNCFKEKALGEMMTYKQEVDGVKFLIHCTRDDQYMTKIMSSHGLFDEIQGSSTGCKIGEQ